MAKIRIGRSSSNDVVLTDTTVSRSHAEIEDIGGGLYRLTDSDGDDRLDAVERLNTINPE